MGISSKLIAILIIAFVTIFALFFILDFLASQGVNEEEPQVVIILFMFLVFFGSSWTILTSK